MSRTPLPALLVVLGTLACGGPTQVPQGFPRFPEVATASGLDFVHFNGFSGEFYYPETYGAGAAFFDADGDGWQDIYLVNGTDLAGRPPEEPPVNRLFRNRRDGTFSDVTAASGAGDPGYGQGVAAADYDGDGDQDLFVANFGPNVLLRNEAGGRFADVTGEAGLGDPRWGSSPGFLDYDLDGDIDLFVANYVHFTLEINVPCGDGAGHRSYCEPSVYEPIGDLLYRNDGDRFTDVTRAAGITLEGRGLGVAFSDYDLDGDTDIYVANDGTMNFLYDNRRGTFAEVGLTSGTRYNEFGHPEAGMGVDFGDYDNDGDQDLFITNFAGETNTLYRNEGQGRFGIVSDEVGLDGPSKLPLGFGMKFIDCDNDADLDLFVANGHVVHRIQEADPAQRYRQPNQMFRNDGGVRFTDVSAELGPQFIEADVGRGTAVGDYDNDGDLDLLVTTVAASARLLRNDGGNRRRWLFVELVGARHPDALGARVTVTADGRRQVKERQSGSSYLSSHDPRLHFGLDQATRADVEIRWPDGSTQRVPGVAADQVLRVVQEDR